MAMEGGVLSSVMTIESLLEFPTASLAEIINVLAPSERLRAIEEAALES